MLDFVLNYPTIAATFALAGALAFAGLWKSAVAWHRERLGKSAPSKRGEPCG